MLYYGSRSNRAKLKESGIELLDLDDDKWVRRTRELDENNEEDLDSEAGSFDHMRDPEQEYDKYDPLGGTGLIAHTGVRGNESIKNVVDDDSTGKEVSDDSSDKGAGYDPPPGTGPREHSK